VCVALRRLRIRVGPSDRQ